MAVGFILLSLGLRLSVSDFKAISTFPKPYFLGLACHVILVPMVTVSIVILFGITGPIAVGFVLVAACPGGGVSNLITRLGNGDVALSVALTATTSMICAVTVPFHLYWAESYFLGQTPEITNVSLIAIKAFVITVVPITIGMGILAAAPKLADAIAGPFTAIAVVFMALIIAGAVAVNWTLFVQNLATLGGAVILLGVALMAMGYGVARGFRIGIVQSKTIAIEAGVQNTSIGLSVAAMITTGNEVFGALALASALYGVVMYFLVIPYAIYTKQWR